MVFEGLSTPAVSALFAVAALAAVLLHLLRTRPRELQVVTSIFWREARAVTQPRRLLYRFRHLFMFLLLLATIALVCLALSGLIQQFVASNRQHMVMVVDAGLSAQATTGHEGETRFTEALRSSDAYLARLSDNDRVCLVVVDPMPRVVHRFDQPLAGARRRLQDIRPADQPAQQSLALALAQRLLAGHRTPRIVHVTGPGQTLSDTQPGEIPVDVLSAGENAANTAILSAAFVAEENQPRLGRVHVRIGTWGNQQDAVQLRVRHVEADREILSVSTNVTPGTTEDFVSAVTPADGGVVEMVLSEAYGTPADNRLALTLPRRGELKVAGSADWPPALGLALEALDGTLVADIADADIEVTDQAKVRSRSGRPQIVLVADGPEVSAEAPLSANPGLSRLADLNLEGCTCGPGATVAAPADTTGFTPALVCGDRILAAVDMDATSTAAPRLVLGEALFARGATFTGNPAFVIFLGRMLEMLNQRESEGLTLPSRRTLLDPVWAGQQRAARRVATVAGDRWASNLSEGSEPASTPEPAPNSVWAWDRLLLVAALLLIVVEGILHARGRIV